jgi:hypothetical protein
MSKQDKSKCGVDANKGSKDNAAVNRINAKGYHDYITGLVEDDDADTVFTSENESNVESKVDDVAKDFAGPSYAPDSKGDATMPKFKEGERHSFEHANCPTAEVVGQKSSGLPKTATLDKPSDTEKEVY